MPNVPKKLIVHHDGASRSGESFDIINAHHKGLGYHASRLGFHVGYHYLIERTGKLRQAREHDEIGAHTIGQNDKSLGICLAGNFDTELPTPSQVATLGALLGSLTSLHKIPATEIYPHRAFGQKSCYGKRLHDLWAREVLADYRGGNSVALTESPRSIVQSAIKQLQDVLPRLT